MSMKLCKGLPRVVLGALAALTTFGAAPALGAVTTTEVTSPTVTVSANPTAGSPVTLTETGLAVPAAVLTVSAQLGPGAFCGQVVIDRTFVSGSYTHTSRFTPTQPGSYLVCLALASDTAGTTQNQLETLPLTVAPAPPGSSGGNPSGGSQQAALYGGVACVAPRLLRHSLAYARRLLASANCTLGRVYRPSSRTLRLARRRAHGRTPRLMVVSQTPRPGEVQRLGANVSVRLGLAAPRPRRGHRQA